MKSGDHNFDYKETHLDFLYDDLLGEYGEKQAKLLYTLMCQKDTDLCKCEMKFESDEMNEHIFKRILPTIGQAHRIKKATLLVADVYSHIIDDDRKLNAQRFEEQFYQTKAAPVGCET